MIYPTLLAYEASKTFVNSYCDHIFYDVASLNSRETAGLPAMGELPIILDVPPTGGGEIRVYRSLGELRANPNRPRAYVLAGAVSSSLGGAALARNVADAWQSRVCAILPSLLHPTWAEPWSGLDPCEQLSDSLVLREILKADDLPVDLILGHSKGSPGVANALKDLETEATVVTVGGVVSLAQRNVCQLLGQLDWLGWMNSRLDLAHEVLPGCGHHLNSQLPGHIDLKLALTARGLHHSRN